MIKPKVAIFSDLHLGIYANSEKWHDVALNWATWMANELKSKNIKDILFLGDFFHNRSELSVQTLHVASEIIEHFKDFEMIMVTGNHDCFYKNRCDVHSLGLLKNHNNITIIDSPQVIQAFGKNLLFVPWNCDLPDGKFDYTFGHFEIQTFKMNNYKVCDHGMDIMDFLASRTSNVFSGHFHHRNTKKYNEGMINYVGNTFPMDFSDIDNVKGYHTLDIESGELEFFENTISPRFKKILASQIKSYKSKDIENNIIKLVIDLEMSDKNVEKFQLYISKFKPWQFTTEYATTTKAINNVEHIDSINLVEVFDEYIKELKFDAHKNSRMETIIKNLYERNK